MGLLDRLSTTVSAAYQALRGGIGARVPDGAIVFDPVQAWRWTLAYTPERLDQIKARRSPPEIVQLFDDMLTDDRIRSVAYMRAQALVGAELEFVEGSGRRKRRALRAADAEADLWDMLPEAEWIQALVWGVGANFGTCRKRWWELNPAGDRYIPRRRNGRIVPRVEFWHPRSFRPDPAVTRGWLARVETPDSATPVDRPVSFRDREFVAFCPWGGDPGFAPERGLVFPASKLWLLKQYVIRDGASLGGRMSTPPRVIEQELVQQGIPIGAEGGADKKREQLVNEVFAMQRKGVVALPAGATMKLLAMPATSVQMLKDQWEACNDAFAILWSGNNLTTSIKGGSLAASDNAQTMFGFVRRFDAAGESTFVHDDVLGDWAEINFGARDSAPWPERDVEPPEDLARKSQTWFALSQAVEKLEKNGWFLDKTDTAEVFSLPLIKGQPNTEKPAPAPAPGQTPIAPQVPNAA